MNQPTKFMLLHSVSDGYDENPYIIINIDEISAVTPFKYGSLHDVKIGTSIKLKNRDSVEVREKVAEIYRRILESKR